MWRWSVLRRLHQQRTSSFSFSFSSPPSPTRFALRFGLCPAKNALAAPPPVLGYRFREHRIHLPIWRRLEQISAGQGGLGHRIRWSCTFPPPGPFSSRVRYSALFARLTDQLTCRIQRVAGRRPAGLRIYRRSMVPHQLASHLHHHFNCLHRACGRLLLPR